MASDLRQPRQRVISEGRHAVPVRDLRQVAVFVIREQRGLAVGIAEVTMQYLLHLASQD